MRSEAEREAIPVIRRFAGRGALYAALAVLLREGLEMGEKGALDTAEIASLERGDADGAGGAVVGDDHKGAVGALLLGHLRHNGNAEPGADHGEDAAELSAFEDDVRRDAGALTDFNGGLAKTVVFAQQEKRLVAQVLERQLAPLGQLMGARQDGKQTLRTQVKRFQIVAAQGKSED